MKLQNRSKQELYLNGSIHTASSTQLNRNSAASQLQKFLSFSKPFTASTQTSGSQRSQHFQREGISKNSASFNQTAISESAMAKRTPHPQERQFITAKNSALYGPVHRQELSDPNVKQSTQPVFIDKRTQPNSGTSNFQTFQKVGLDKVSDTYDLSKQISTKEQQAQKYQFRKQPIMSEYTKSSQTQVTAGKKLLLTHRNSQVGRAISPNSKVRLRDYLFMMNTSASAAYKKKAQDIRQTKQMSFDYDTAQKHRTLELCRSNRSIDINNRYHQQKYKVNRQELQYVLKSQINQQMGKLRNHLQESSALLVRMDSISEEQIPCWNELRRMMAEANKKIGEAISSLKSLTSTSQSIFLEKTNSISNKSNQSFHKITP